MPKIAVMLDNWLLNCLCFLVGESWYYVERYCFIGDYVNLLICIAVVIFSIICLGSLPDALGSKTGCEYCLLGRALGTRTPHLVCPVTRFRLFPPA